MSSEKQVKENPIGEAIKLLIEYAKENGRLKSEISMLNYEKARLQEKILKLEKEAETKVE